MDIVTHCHIRLCNVTSLSILDLWPWYCNLDWKGYLSTCINSSFYKKDIVTHYYIRLCNVLKPDTLGMFNECNNSSGFTCIVLFYTFNLVQHGLTYWHVHLQIWKVALMNPFSILVLNKCTLFTNELKMNAMLPLSIATLKFGPGS